MIAATVPEDPGKVGTEHAPQAPTPGLSENVDLAPYTTLGIGGPARWFATATDEAHVQPAIAFAAAHELPVFVLGGGSNLLVSDAGFPGLVLHIALRGTRTAAVAPQGTLHVIAAAGESWDQLVQYTVERNLQGMECLAGIPGTVGGTPVQNVGAYGQDVSQTIVSARCFDRVAMQFVHLTHADFGFGYRTSLLNTAERGRYIITSVTFALKQGGEPTLTFPELKRALADDQSPTLLRTAEAVRALRRRKGMVVDPSDPDSRSAGSFFRNPIVPASVLPAVAQKAGVPETQVPHWPAGEGSLKFAAAWLLEHAGFVRGTTLGRAAISSKHTLALINRGGATEAEIAALRDHIAAGVREQFGIALEQEPVNVGPT